MRSADAEAQILERIARLSSRIDEPRREFGERAPRPGGRSLLGRAARPA